MPKKLYTIGHSNHTLADFIEILLSYHITHLVDIRTIPKSRYVSWTNQTKLSSSLKREQIKYLHMSELGGLRPSKKNSINTAWNNKNFRGFADYMQTNEFFQALKKLNKLLCKENKVVIMCAEAVPWRCHRSLIADAEIARHVEVWDIFSKTNVRPHLLTVFAVINRHKKPIQVYYPKDLQ